MIFEPRELKRRMILRLKSLELERPLIGPATVQVHLTDLCNLACRYCYYYGPDSEHRPTGKNHFPLDSFSRIISDCTDLQVDMLYLSGEGDPTLHPQFSEILRMLRDRSFSVTAYSNGTFPLERCREILQGVDRIVINLGEADRTSYRLLQGRDLFMRVIRNIRELSRLRPQVNPDFRIEVVFIATRLNNESHARTEALIKKMGADLIQKKSAEISEHNQHIMFPDQARETLPDGQWPPCYYGWFYSSIRLNGDVHVCCFMQRLTIGNIFKHSFREVWESKEYAQTRQAALTGHPFRQYQECINCRVAWRNKEVEENLKLYRRTMAAL